MLRWVIAGYVPCSSWRVAAVAVVACGMIAVRDRCAGGALADPRDVLIREQAETIAALEAMVADLREQLEAALRAGSRNSGNSSMPPSSDDLPGRTPSRQQRRAAERAAKKKKQGKQPGSPARR